MSALPSPVASDPRYTSTIAAASPTFASLKRAPATSSAFAPPSSALPLEGDPYCTYRRRSPTYRCGRGDPLSSTVSPPATGFHHAIGPTSSSMGSVPLPCVGSADATSAALPLALLLDAPSYFDGAASTVPLLGTPTLLDPTWVLTALSGLAAPTWSSLYNP